LEHLSDPDGAQRSRAWVVLALAGTPGSVPAMEDAAKKEMDARIRNDAAAAIRQVKLRR
jgi:hypothetical protein